MKTFLLLYNKKQLVYNDIHKIISTLFHNYTNSTLTFLKNNIQKI